MSCLPLHISSTMRTVISIPSTIWPLPGEMHLPSIYLPDGRHGGELEVARDKKSTKYREGKLLYSSTCNFADREGQCYYQDVFAVLNL